MRRALTPLLVLLTALPAPCLAALAARPAARAVRLPLAAGPAAVALGAPALSARSPLALAPSLAAAPVPLAAPAVSPMAALAAASDAPAVEPGAATETAAAGAARAFDLALPRDASEAPADAPRDPGAPESAPAQRLADPPNERPFLLRHYGLVKSLASPVLKLVYPVHVAGETRIPKTGPAIIVANHAGYIDPLLLAYAAGRTVRFLMYRGIYELRGLQWLFRSLGAIPVGAGESRELLERSMGAARAALRDGEIVVIFPEGRLTHTGGMDKFKRGFENLARETGAPVIPAHIDGAWGSVFSRREDFRSLPRRVLAEVRRRTAVRFGPALAVADAPTARQAVQELGADAMEARIRANGRTLGREFFVSAKKRWSLPALSDSDGRRLDYGGTLTESLLLGAALEPRLGAARSVGVWLPASADAALANLALTLRGRVPVNLSTSASARALVHAASLAGLDAVVTSRRFAAAGGAAALPPGLRVVYVEDLAPASWKRALTRALLRLLPRAWGEALFARRAARGLDETAAVLFTGGPDGLPRGVELTHLNLRANSEMIREAYSFRPDDVILGTLPLFHSFGFAMTLWTPLLKGISVAYHARPRDALAVARWAAASRATVLLATPALLQRWLADAPDGAFSTMRFAAAGAERLAPELAEDFRARFGIRPLEGYGATELSPVAAVNVPDRGPQEGGRAGTVGRPLPGLAMRVVDPVTFEVLPPGREGLLLVKGASVMKGYVGVPARAAAVMRDGWYVTGDIALMQREGFVVWVRRAPGYERPAR